MDRQTKGRRLLHSLLFPHPAVVLLCAPVAGLGISMAVQAARRGKR